MDFIKGNEQVRIDPSGIDISGVGNIIIDSNSITGDISFNSKVNFTGDVSMNGKVTVSEILDVTGDLSMNGIIDLNGTLDMCGNIKFEDTHVDGTWFGPDLKGGMNIDGGGWTMMKNLPPNSSQGFNESSTDGNFTQQEGIESLTHVFGRPTSDLTFTPDEVLFTTILNNGERIWWIFDYTKCDNTNIGQPGWVSGYSTWSKNDSVIKSKSTNNNITYVNSPGGTHIFDTDIYLTSGGINPTPFSDLTGGSLSLRLGPNSGQYPIYRPNIAPGTASTDYNTELLYYQGMSIFFRDSTNPKQYSTLIKKESDHLHITAPLNIYPEGNYELDDLGLSGDIDLKFDGRNGTDANVTVDNAGGWYLVRQANAVASSLYNRDFFHMDNFNFGISYGTKENGETYPSGHFYTRNVNNYDYDEVLFHMIDPVNAGQILWQIWDRTALESLMSRYDGINLQVTGVKKSSQSVSPHTVEAAVRSSTHPLDPGIGYGYPGNGAFGGGRWWNVTENHANNRSYYVRRADGQPVRLKNRVKVDVDGNLDVDGIITCSQITASKKSDSGVNGLTVTSEGFVGIGTSDPKVALHVEDPEKSGRWGNLGIDRLVQWAEAYRLASGTWASGGLGHTVNPDTPVTLYASKIACYGIIGFSDRRIKRDISLVDDDTALKQVNALESHEYNYIDPRQTKQHKTIGFIAQEVKEIIPNAVSLHKEWIPDEMRIISETQWEGSTLTIPDLDMSGNFTGKAKFYVSNDPSGNDEVCKELEIKEVHTDDSTPLFPKTKFVAEFDKPWTNVFFYGKEVTDFHKIDKNQIFSLHHSAIQELSRKNVSLQEEVSAKTAKITSLETRLEALETALLAMQSLVEGLH